MARPDRVMEAGDFDTSETESVLSYRVDTEEDYGRLVCRSDVQITHVAPTGALGSQMSVCD